MSISPVPNFDQEAAASVAEANPRRRPSPTPEENVVPPDQGTSPKPEARSVQSAAASTELPEDEVQVQRETGGDEIVVRYMDHAGNLVLQVPSSQVLDLAKAISQDLEKQAQARVDREANPGQGEQTHGH
jgi:hypothetical protein